jgi:hypothetical protein
MMDEKARAREMLSKMSDDAVQAIDWGKVAHCAVAAVVTRLVDDKVVTEVVDIAAPPPGD